MGELVDRDQENLRQLTLGYYIMAAYIAFFSLMGLLYVGFGAVIMSGLLLQAPDSQDGLRGMGIVFASIGTIFVLTGVFFAFLNYRTGRNIQDRRRRVFCLIVAGFSCLHVPWGTALGVCTILVLERPSVKALFEPPALPPTPPPPLE